MIEFVWLIPAIMLLAALVNGLGARRLGKTAGHVAWIAMAICCVISFAILFQVVGLAHDHHWEGTKVLLWKWFDIPNFFGPNRTFSVEMAFRVDQLTAVFLCFVSFIGTLVFIYATGYMKEKHHGHLELDPGYARFFAYVSLFAASMFTLVLGANLGVMFIGWEGVGLCSYLLIGYYFDRPFSDTLSCADAGRKAFVMNRIGDAGLIVGIGLIFWGLGTVDFAEINAALTSGQLPDGSAIPAGFKYGGALVTASMLCMFLGATGKSAQIPLFTWLPDAMAGPTPVSALIHAATMVTAGVYMVARLNVPFFLSPGAMAVVAIVGALTAFAAATMGLTQRGIKKALAYSTVSQLGFMFLGLGVGAMAGGIFHVFTHAFFKGCLFLAAGSVIHALHHEEDMFKMGGLRKHMPKTWLAYLMATLAIAGFPLTSGFFSKDEILFSAFISAGDGLPILWAIGVVTAVMTAIYMGRTLFLTFHGPERFDDHAREHLHESPANLTTPILILGALGLVVGFLNVPHGFGGGAHFHHFLAPVVDRGAEHVAAMRGFQTDHAAGIIPAGPLVVAGADGAALAMDAGHKSIERTLAVASGLLGIAGLAIAWWFFGAGITDRSRRLARVLQPLWRLSFHRWWWDDVYTALFQKGTMLKARIIWQLDVAVVDGAVVGMAEGCRSISRSIRRLQNGQVQVYGLVMFIGVCLFLVYFAIGMNNFIGQTGEEPQQGRRILHNEPSPRAIGEGPIVSHSIIIDRELVQND
jgi:NADH-quinone oxidoreductase subunit L